MKTTSPNARRRHATFALLSVIGLAACATTSSDAWSAAVPLLQPGQTTAADVSALLGQQPRTTTRTAKGNLLLQWMSGNRVLSIVFDQQGRLMSVVQAHNVAISDADRKRLFLPPPA